MTTIYADIRREVDERFASGEFLAHLMQRMAERKTKNILSNLFGSSSGTYPYIYEYRELVDSKIGIQKRISRILSGRMFWNDGFFSDECRPDLDCQLDYLYSHRDRVNRLKKFLKREIAEYPIDYPMIIQENGTIEINVSLPVKISWKKNKYKSKCRNKPRKFR